MNGKKKNVENFWSSSEDVRKKFDLNEDGAIDYDEFVKLCHELFGENEVELHYDKIFKIFRLLDRNEIGSLKNEDWRFCYDKWIKVVLNPVNVFLIVDVQNDFIDGSLALKDLGLGQDGRDVVEPINDLIEQCSWDKVVYSLDWHPSDHVSFYDNLYMRKLHPDSKIQKENAKLFDTVKFESGQEQKLWPIHCVSNTWGSQLHKDLLIAENSIQVYKGQNPEVDSYSAFFDNNAKNATDLPEILKKIDATDVYVCGLAYDVCVTSSCMDGLKLGYRIVLVENCCRGVDPRGIDESRKKILNSNGLTLDVTEVKDHVTGKKRSLVMALQGAQSLFVK